MGRVLELTHTREQFSLDVGQVETARDIRVGQESAQIAGADKDLAGPVVIVEGAHTHKVPGAEEALFAFVPEGEGEVAQQMGGAFFPPAAVGVE